MRFPAGGLYRLGWLLAGALVTGFALWAAAWIWADLMDAEGLARLLETADSDQTSFAQERAWRRLTTASAINPLS
jgi:hypothetical protein